MAVFCSVLQEKGIRTDAEEYLGKFQGRFERDDLKSAFFNIKIVSKVLKAVLSDITN